MGVWLHKWRTMLIFLMAFVIGSGSGFWIRGLITSAETSRNKRAYVEKREGQQNNINPLLACDVADDVISNPELIPFREKVEKYISTKMDKRWAVKVSVYYRELNDGYWFSIGDADKFIPASLRKVPLMIALLKQAEKAPGLLNRLVTFDLANDYNQNQNFKPLHSLVFGQQYSVRDLIFRMIAYSDNNAFTYLTKIVDPEQFDQVYYRLRLQNPRSIKDDEFLSVQTYESFFRILYNASYLSREASDWALEVLSKSEFKTGLVSGVPPTVKVAHKFGEKSDAVEGTVQLHDCGIVYYPQHPYLLCVMTKGPNFEFLDDVIANISQITFIEVDKQHREH